MFLLDSPTRVKRKASQRDPSPRLIPSFLPTVSIPEIHNPRGFRILLGFLPIIARQLAFFRLAPASRDSSGALHR